jgi:hypothetical protein
MKVVIFAFSSYALMILANGRMKISILEWFGLMLLVFTLSYIPTIVRLFKNRKD